MTLVRVLNSISTICLRVDINHLHIHRAQKGVRWTDAILWRSSSPRATLTPVKLIRESEAPFKSRTGQNSWILLERIYSAESTAQCTTHNRSGMFILLFVSHIFAIFIIFNGVNLFYSFYSVLRVKNPRWFSSLRYPCMD